MDLSVSICVHLCVFMNMVVCVEGTFNPLRRVFCSRQLLEALKASPVLLDRNPSFALLCSALPG